VTRKINTPKSKNHEHIHPHARRVFATSFSTGPPEDRGALEAHFTAAGMPSQRNHPDSFRFKCAAFYQSLKSKVGLAATKAAALRINLNVEGCVIVADPLSARSSSRSQSPPPPSFTQSPSPPRSLVRDGQGERGESRSLRWV